MDRKPHYLKMVTGKPMPVCHVVMQCEIYTEKVGASDDVLATKSLQGTAIRFRWRDGNAYDRRETRFHDNYSLWSDVARLTAAGNTVWLWSYDVRTLAAACGLWDLLLDGQAYLDGEDVFSNPSKVAVRKKVQPGYCVLEGPPTVIRFRLAMGRAACQWVDVQNFGVDSDAKLLHDMQVDLGQASCDGSLPDSFEANDKCFARATEHFVLSLLRLVESRRLGALQTTAAGQAQHAYRHRWMPDRILVHDSPAVLVAERDAAYAGRCEAYHIGYVESEETEDTIPGGVDKGAMVRPIMGSIYHYDVNSLYPSVAVNTFFPSALTGTYDDVPPADVVRMAEGIGVIADCRVETDEPCVPVRLDTRRLGGGQMLDRGKGAAHSAAEALTVYPVGRYWTTLCGPEILLAAECGRVVECRNVSTYVPADLFTGMIGELWELRQSYAAAGKRTMASVCKRLMNAVFGKFAQRSKRWIDEPTAVHHEPFAAWWGIRDWKGLPSQWRSLAWKVQRLAIVGEHPESCPAINAYVMSLARVRLWKLMAIAGRENVLYTDTDSLWVTQEGSGRLLDALEVFPDRLGKLKEVAVYPWVEFRGIKHYVTPAGTVCAGLTPDAELVSEDYAVIRKAVPVDSFLWRGEKPAAWTVEAKKRLHVPYRHGIVDGGGHVHPLSLYDEGPCPRIRIPLA